jgi:hypothetical protein
MRHHAGSNALLGGIFLVSLISITVLLDPARGQSPSPPLIQSPKEVQGLEANRPSRLYLLPAERKTGTTTAGIVPSCVGSSRGIECFTRSLASSPALLTAVFSNGNWSSWTSLGGSITSDPSCFNPGPGLPRGAENISCIALGLNSRLWLLKRSNGQWSSNWQSIDFGANIHAPDGISCIHEGIQADDWCYVRQRAGDTLARIRSRNSTSGWTNWELIQGGTIHGKPWCIINNQGGTAWHSCYSWRNGQLVRWRAGEYGGSSAATIPPEWQLHAGLIASPPSCAERGGSGSNFVVCTALKADGSFQFREAINPATNLWQHVPGSSLASPPTCLRGGVCIAVGRDQKLWRFDLPPSSGGSTKMVQIPGTVPLRPGVSCLQAGNIHCFAVTTTSSELMHYEIAL